MKNSLETRLGMFVALAMVAGFLILETLGGWDMFQSGHHLRAQFKTVQDLKAGDFVKIAGVPVGRVDRIQLVADKVEVRMKLNADAPVHTDSKATIKFTGLMGQYYVSIDFGSTGAPLMTDNQLIATTEQPDISEIMAKMDDVATGVQNLTKSFSGDKIDNILGPLVTFMKENNPRITAILGNVQAISTQVASGKGTVGRLINEDTLYTTAYATITNLQDVSADAKGAVAQARAMMDQVNAGQGTIGKLVKDDTLYRETTATMSNVRQITDKINSGQGSVGKLVNDQEFYKNAKMSLQKLDKAMESLEDTGPLSLFGTVVSSLL
jgi:phospholipid/cholesterol/gamma-HCH transport system substrate-binding protein